MRKFKVILNDQVFEVSVEEEGAIPVQSGAVARTVANRPLSSVSIPPVRMLAPSVTMAPAPAKPVSPPAPIQAPRKEPSAAGETVVAPLPGTITDVKVSTGQQVAASQVIMILEAMKMENEITTPVDGKVAEMLVSKGQNVGVGDPMVVIR